METKTPRCSSPYIKWYRIYTHPPVASETYLGYWYYLFKTKKILSTFASWNLFSANKRISVIKYQIIMCTWYICTHVRMHGACIASAGIHVPVYAGKGGSISMVTQPKLLALLCLLFAREEVQSLLNPLWK